MANWTLPLKLLYSVVISCCFVVPAIVGYGLHIRITKQSLWTLGVYGLVVFVFIALQVLFASLNRLMIKRCRNNNKTLVSRTLATIPTNARKCTSVGVAVVGYREEPELFDQCLASIRKLSYPDPLRIVVVVDGDEEADQEMARVFRKAFPSSPVVNLSLPLAEYHWEGADHTDNENENSEKPSANQSLDEMLAQITLPNDIHPVCYLQPHKGKRHAMYSAFKILMASGCETIMTTDSDTIFDPEALQEMEQAMHFFPGVGAVAGDVRIWNHSDSILAFMSSLRYWMAFNIERASQSFNRCVTCVSGPMGLYRSEALSPILDKWIAQRFLGMECTYGDDRHLTNCVLNQGYRVIFTHYAFCQTETPASFLRWFRQQTRWSKSFYREILWNSRCLHKHSPWMAAELFYQGIYPFVFLFSVFYILSAQAPVVLLAWLISLMAMASIKAFYALIVSRSLKFFAFPLYSVYYLFGLIPAKLWALVSLWDVGWGTSARAASERKRESVWIGKVKMALPIVAWIVLIFAGVAFNTTAYFINPNRNPALWPTPPDPTSIVFYRMPQ